ncbi:MAG: matrixin family metalloprotease [Myxococcota bacterium]
MKRTTTAIVAIASVLIATPSFAFELSKTITGATVHWDDSEVVYLIHSRGTRQMSKAEAQATIVESFETWNHHGAALALTYGGETNDGQHGYSKEQPNANVVIWEDDHWPYDPNALAMTLTSFERTSGRLVDADIIINSADYQWATDGASDRHDLANSLTHEVGHFIGLGHSESEHATMFPSAAPGEVLKRSLYDDDIRGLNALYANTNQAVTADNGAWTDQAVASDSEEAGYRINDAEVHLACSTSAPTGSPRSGFGALISFFGLLLAAAFIRRRQASSHAPVAATATVLVCILALTASPSSANATTLPALSLEQVSSASERVVLAEVTHQAASFNGGVIWTVTTIRIEECWSGDCKTGDTMTVRTPGGVVGDIEQRVHGITPMHTGDHMVLFLEPEPHTLGQVFRPFGMALGALTIRQLGQDTVAIRDLSDVSLMTQDKIAVHGEEHSFALKLDELRRLIVRD